MVTIWEGKIAGELIVTGTIFVWGRLTIVRGGWQEDGDTPAFVIRSDNYRQTRCGWSSTQPLSGGNYIGTALCRAMMGGVHLLRVEVG